MAEDSEDGTLPAWQGKHPSGGASPRTHESAEALSEKQYALMQATAYFEGRWRECRHGKCRKARKCKGGPRGTFTRFGYPDCYTLAEAAQFGGESGQDVNEIISGASRNGSPDQVRG